VIFHTLSKPRQGLPRSKCIQVCRATSVQAWVEKPSKCSARPLETVSSTRGQNAVSEPDIPVPRILTFAEPFRARAVLHAHTTHSPFYIQFLFHASTTFRDLSIHRLSTSPLHPISRMTDPLFCLPAESSLLRRRLSISDPAVFHSLIFARLVGSLRIVVTHQPPYPKFPPATTEMRAIQVKQAGGSFDLVEIPTPTPGTSSFLQACRFFHFSIVLRFRSSTHQGHRMWHLRGR
jgi:hypothetical protein